MHAGSNRVAAILLAAAVAAAPGAVRRTEAAAPGLKMARVPAGTALKDPAAPFWNGIEPARVPLAPQSITTPALAKAAVDSVRVRAAHDGTTWAVRLEWNDPTKSDRIVVDNFGDQVAVELPMKYQAGALPSPMMGNPGGRVAVLQWRAAFQNDLDYGHPKLRDVYPNAIVDLYPDQVLSAIDAKPYTGALGVDNPVSTAPNSPVLDQMAEGFGTMTVKAEQHADGRGVWGGSRWAVVVTHPLSGGGENDPDVRPGRPTALAFAVWEGGHAEVGSRKAWAPWVEVEVEP